MTEQQRTDFELAAKPLIKWLCENMHPHATVIVTPDSAELLEGLVVMQTAEFVKG